MFGFFDVFIRRVNDQATEYATAQSDIARRVWGEWVDPLHVLQPAKATVDRRAHGRTPRREASYHRQRF
ncbi:hypothetical protein FQV39_21480 [Bosea sp. F3-2]|uniref:hypothetical protein n=1 Tax=Bosea sp. F3-2 TaxID=2599640 RepID=UPI0011EC0166|nr:hypothetical protein [Bosea sp. F3-2]QEL24871.1 hypothetical protein FQV39_21480 [Bosea sp. F3-2]